MKRLYSAQPEGRGTLKEILKIELAHLEESVKQINQMLKKRGKWDVNGMIRAQEYVKRRATFLGVPGMSDYPLPRLRIYISLFDAVVMKVTVMTTLPFACPVST
jgi:hypothetical protein